MYVAALRNKDNNNLANEKGRPMISRSILPFHLPFRLPFQNQNGKEENYDANWCETAAYNNLAKEKGRPTECRAAQPIYLQFL